MFWRRESNPQYADFYKSVPRYHIATINQYFVAKIQFIL